MTKPFICKDHAAHRAAVEAGYAPLSDYVREAPHPIPITHDVFALCQQFAERDDVSVHVWINEALRQWCGDR